ncbi:MAG: hypothetical protein NVS2B14_01220 [Chamaesiphon sp.]
MTNGDRGDRLDRLEAIVESNSRAIQAMLDNMAESAHERRELRESSLRLAGLTEGITSLLVSLDEDRPTILRKLTNIENKVDRLLQLENRDDVAPRSE